MRYLFEDKGGESPNGSNDLRASDAYVESEYYDIKFPQARNQAKPITVRATIRGLYGKVDGYGFAVIPKEEYISQISSSSKGTFEALYVVKESFEEMAEYYRQLELRGKLRLDSKTLKELAPKKAWKNPKTSYTSYRESIVNEFVSIKNTDLPEIIDYRTFEKSFMEYAASTRSPLTMSGFCTSNLSDPRHSGLVIDLATEDYSEDKVKYEGYIKDSNFQVFRKVVNRYGFRIDKHIPWRLYFDISHPYSKRKLSRYGVGSIDEFFAKYYDRIADLEIEGLDSVMNSAYSQYYNTDPTYLVSKYCSKTGTSKISTKYREIPSLEKLRKNYGENHWIRSYVYFRALESGSKWNQAKFDKVVRESLATYKYRGTRQMTLQLEPYFIDKTSELFQKRDLTNRNSFDRIITDFKF